MLEHNLLIVDDNNELKKELDNRRRIMVAAVTADRNRMVNAILNADTKVVEQRIVANNESAILKAVIASTALRKAYKNKKYSPHQGKNEKWRRAFKKYESHLFQCSCDTCEYVRTNLNIQSAL